jgi:hypothetical protein
MEETPSVRAMEAIGTKQGFYQSTVWIGRKRRQYPPFTDATLFLVMTVTI